MLGCSKYVLGVFDGRREKVDFFDGIIDADGEAGAGSDAEVLVNRLCAVMTGAETDALAAKNFCKVVWVDCGESKTDTAALRL